MTPKTKTLLSWASAFVLLALLVLGVRACFSAREGVETPETRVQQTKQQIREKANDSTDRTPDAVVRDRVWSDADVRRFGQGAGKGGVRQNPPK